MRELSVCVVIPVYNGRDLVDKCIRALLDQTVKPDMIVCVDDASPDGSSGYLRRKFPFVQVLENKANLGVSATYARGIKKAFEDGFERVWLLDQDDVPFKDALENLLEASRGNKLAAFASALVDPSATLVYPVLSRGCRDISKPHVAVVTDFAGMFLDRRLIKDVGLPLAELTMDAGDWEYCLRCRRQGYEMHVVPQSRIRHVPGCPVMVKRPLMMRSYELRNGEIRKVSSKHGLTRLDSPQRYYTQTRNTILVMKLPYASMFFRKFALKLVAKHVLKILLYESRKAEKIWMVLRGVIDGLSRGLTGGGEEL